MAWPDEGELLTYLQASGLVSLTPSSVQNLLDLPGALATAIERWNDATRYWPFLSTGSTSETRTFEPPAGFLLDLDGGLLTFTSMVSERDYDGTQNDSLSTGNTRLNLRDIRLCPTNAPQKVMPWTYMELGWTATVGIIQVTGEWGYTTAANLPETARRGVMAFAAQELAPQIEMHMSRGGLKKLQQGDSTKEWGGLDFIVSGWQTVAANAAKHYRRARLVSA